MARKASIDKFLTSLSPWEIIYVRDALRSGKVSVQGLASFDDLPDELADPILCHLRLEDIFNCLLVSRGWWSKIKNEDVSRSLCKRFFPGLLNTETKPAPVLFLEAVRRYRQRRPHKAKRKRFIGWNTGWSTKTFSNPVQPVDDSSVRRDPSFDEERLIIRYKDGNLAWQPNPTTVIIDNLRTLNRLHCPLGRFIVSGQALRLIAVTRSLVVLGHSAMPNNHVFVFYTVSIWHMIDKKWETLSLPGDCWECFATDDRAAFATSEGEVFVWSWGSKTFSERIFTHSIVGNPSSDEMIVPFEGKLFKANNGLAWDDHLIISDRATSCYSRIFSAQYQAEDEFSNIANEVKVHACQFEVDAAGSSHDFTEGNDQPDSPSHICNTIRCIYDFSQRGTYHGTTGDAEYQGEKVPAVRTQARSATILPNFVGLRFEIHNGKDYESVLITENMVGHKLGEFSPTRKQHIWRKG
ncbi:hypothetical protein L249_3125 [Ophiocordyceps polyrhachis-furcata BCC 54312]|uniref:F-box domain-containing protein n=1 Tax=Ophiocordyceps polyrhachis-furcata BCC 54312 TaxID=1330021 RepID=A0A367LPQ4_9HYPO|nr:hypothetical protein L249_3125 [Ophiocordyceps polyrhachis-furcata BCC 54312]